jgi:hypothetical protein
MSDPQHENKLELSHSKSANNGQSRQSIPAVFAGEQLEGSGFEEELPEDGFQWRERQ